MSSEKKTIVLLGKNGIGKSSVGNVLLGEKKFKTSLTETGGTKVCQIEESDQLVVVDTPGFFQNSRPDINIAAEIITTIKQKLPMGLHVFILVLSVDPLFTGDEDECLEFVKILVGEENINNNMIVVFTRKDSSEDFRMNEFTKPRCLPDVPCFIINCRDVDRTDLSRLQTAIHSTKYNRRLDSTINGVDVIQNQIQRLRSSRQRRMEPNIEAYRIGLESRMGIRTDFWTKFCTILCYIFCCCWLCSIIKLCCDTNCCDKCKKVCCDGFCRSCCETCCTFVA